MYAIIKTGGKQYRVQKNDEIYVELLDAKVGETVVFDEVLMHGDTIGTPLVKGVQVSGTVVKHGKQKKITIFKFKAKKDYRNKKGHRQNYTLVKIEEIGKATAAKKPAAKKETTTAAKKPAAKKATTAAKKPAAKK